MPNGWEWGILVVIALLLFAGSRLSGVGSNLGSSIREFKDEIAVPPDLETAELPPADGHAKPSIVAESSAPNVVAELFAAGAPEASAEAPSDSDPV